MRRPEASPAIQDFACAFAVAKSYTNPPAVRDMGSLHSGLLPPGMNCAAESRVLVNVAPPLHFSIASPSPFARAFKSSKSAPIMSRKIAGSSMPAVSRSRMTRVAPS